MIQCAEVFVPTIVKSRGRIPVQKGSHFVLGYFRWVLTGREKAGREDSRMAERLVLPQSYQFLPRFIS
jgi:hypothetical protein